MNSHRVYGLMTSGVSVLLLIPEKTYMGGLYNVHAIMNQTKDKIALLRNNFLFMSWSIDQLVTLAYGMKKMEYFKNDKVVGQGETSEHVYLIVKGKVKVSISNEVGLVGTSILGEKAGNSNKVVEIAELGENDIIGLVELTCHSPTMGRSITASSTLEVFVMSMSLFGTTMANSKATKEIIGKVVEKRKYWESLRLDYATKFPSVAFSLPANAAEMSQYSLSAMNDIELRELKETKSFLFQSLREVRSSYRSAITKVKQKKFEEAIAELEKSKTACDRAIEKAVSVQDDKIEQQAREIMEVVVKQLGVQRSALFGIDSALLPVEQTPSDGTRGRRDSAGLVAMRKRILVGPNPPSEKSPEVPGIRARRATTRMHSDSRKSLEMSRENWRTSIAELAKEAGLKQQFGELDRVRKVSVVNPVVEERERRQSRRTSDVELKNMESLLDDLLVSAVASPTPPSESLIRKKSLINIWGGGARKTF